MKVLVGLMACHNNNFFLNTFYNISLSFIYMIRVYTHIYIIIHSTDKKKKIKKIFEAIIYSKNIKILTFSLSL